MRKFTLLFICLLSGSMAFTQDKSISFIKVPTELKADCASLPTVDDIKVKSICKGAIDISFEDTRSVEDCNNILRTIIAKDACGNVNSFTQVIIFEDDVAPVFSRIPEDLNLVDRYEYMDHPGLVFPEVSDNCSGEVRTNVVHKDEIIGDKYYIYRTYIAIDACGNKTEHTQTVTIQVPSER